MKDYNVYGGRIRSAVEFENLAAPDHEGRPDWRLEMAVSPLPRPVGRELGSDRVQDGVEVRLHRSAAGVLLAYDDTGEFHLSSDGRRIIWSPGPTAEPDAVRMDVLGRVLPLALHLQGFLVLHASAVVHGAGAVGFVGPKRSGKSTLALALHREGFRVLTDDVLVLDARDDEVRARPGVPDLRLRHDAASAAGVTSSDGMVLDGGRRTLLRVDRDPVTRSVPLASLFLLDPPSPDSPATSTSTRSVSGRRAAAALVGQSKLGPLLAGWDAGSLLERASAVARSVPVRSLTLPRGLERLRAAVPAVLGAADGAPGEGAKASR